MSFITIPVRKKHYDAAQLARARGRLVSETCLVSQAVRDFFGEDKLVSTGNSKTRVSNGAAVEYLLDTYGKDAVAKFDRQYWRWHEFVDFEITLEVSPE